MSEKKSGADMIREALGSGIVEPKEAEKWAKDKYGEKAVPNWNSFRTAFSTIKNKPKKDAGESGKLKTVRVEAEADGPESEATAPKPVAVAPKLVDDPAFDQAPDLKTTLTLEAVKAMKVQVDKLGGLAKTEEALASMTKLLGADHAEVQRLRLLLSELKGLSFKA